MIRSRRFVLCLTLATLGVLATSSRSSAQAVQRPLADFLGPSLAAPTIVWTEPGNPVTAVVDYFGRLTLAQGLNLGSTYDGQVTERPLADGTAHVRVVLHARRVLMYAYDNSQANAMVFGSTAAQVKAGARPALGDATLTVEFINSAPGAPLPSFLEVIFGPNVLKQLLVANAAGTLTAAYGVPAGTAGRLHLTQRGIFNAPGLADNPAQDNVYPVETVTLTVTGKR